MKCKNYFFSLFVALLGVFFGSYIINQNDTYAVSDITYTINSSNYSDSYTFCSLSTNSCDDYHYFYVTSDCSEAYINRYSNFSYFLYSKDNSTVVQKTLEFNMNVLSFDLLYFSRARSFSYSPVSGWSTISSDCSVVATLSENNPFGGSSPSGSIELTENGTYDVSQYAEAVVNVPETDCPPSSGGGGNYHEDLVAINNSILICAAVCLVIYFFYCIYRMIIKNSGVK